MGTYNVPRNVKGESKILFIFSRKSFIYTGIGAALGLPFYLIFAIFNLHIPGIIAMFIVALIGFSIGTFKIPEIGILKATRTIGGEKIDDIIVRLFKFKQKKNKIYVYTKEEEKNG